MIPFQLSPVDTLKRVRKAMPKLVNVACRLRPSQGFSSLQSEGERSRSPSVKPCLPVLIQNRPKPGVQTLRHVMRASERTVNGWSHDYWGDHVTKFFSVEADDIATATATATLWLRRSRLDIRKVVFTWKTQQPWDRSPERQVSSALGSLQDLAGQSYSDLLLMGLQVGGWVRVSRGLFHQRFSCLYPNRQSQHKEI